MKHAKKLAGLLLAMIMVFAMATTAFAAGTNSITVNGAQKDETYKLYKMLDLSVNEANTAYSYTVNSNWTNFFTNNGDGAGYVDIDAQGYVTWKANKNTADEMEKFGKAAAAFAAAQNPSIAVATKTPTTDGSFSFSNLDAGYYLITSTNGTLAIVDTTPTDPAVTVNEKNADSTLDKKVQEDSNSSFGTENSAQIGDTVNFQVTINLKKGAKNVVLHDAMGDGLTFSGAGSVAIVNSSNNATLTKGTDYDYTVVTTDLTDGCDFEIRFTQTYLDSLTTDTTLTATYSAVLNENATTAGVNNTAQLKWGDHSETTSSTTTTKTYQFEVLKYAATDTAKKPLAGATFQLKNASNNVVKLIKVSGSETEYRVANGDETGAVNSFTTVASGKIVIKGVDLDKYTLVETAAPAGYNKLKDPVDVTVLNTNGLTVEVPNATGTELPSTGGMGTTIFYVVGSILVIGAAVLLITRKRMSNKH